MMVWTINQSIIHGTVSNGNTLPSELRMFLRGFAIVDIEHCNLDYSKPRSGKENVHVKSSAGKLDIQLLFLLVIVN